MRHFTMGAAGEPAAAGNAIVTAGAECISDFIIPDGRGGLTQVDHVVKLPIGIAVIETKNYGGKIYGTEREKTWTQAIGSQRNKFQNPLRQNFLHVEAIKEITGDGVDVLGQVIFVGDAKFREMPDGVSGVADFKRHLRNVREIPVPEPVEQAWAKLRAAMQTDPAARQEHLAQVKAKRRPTT